MFRTIAITQKGQIHLPQDLRDILGFQVPGQAVLEIKDNALLLKPKEGIALSAGKFKKYLKNNPQVDMNQIRDQIDYSSL